MNKIFVVGLDKTGTSSISKALRILNYSVIESDAKFIDIYEKSDINYFMNFIKQYDAGADLPWCVLYKELYKKYPNAKYILTTRENENIWVKSHFNHFLQTNTKGKELISRYFRTFYKLPYPINHGEELKKIYITHNTKVREFFDGMDNFIDVNVSDVGWNELCNFVNKDIPQQPFPRIKQSDYTMYDKMLRIAKRRYV